jgi:hypothetical protein
MARFEEMAIEGREDRFPTSLLPVCGPHHTVSFEASFTRK